MCRMKIRLFALLLVLPLWGCTGKESAQIKNAPSPVRSPAAAPAATLEVYHGKGTITATNPKFPSIEMEHEEIVGLMPAMKMEFYLRDVSMLKDVKPGDRIEFTLENGIGGLKITQITQIKN